MMENGSERSFDSPLETAHSETGIIISAPENGLLWRGEEANLNDLISSLKKVFEAGFTPGSEQSPLAKLPYIQSHPDFICASNTYLSGNEFIGFDNEKISAGMYGYIYLIDTSHNMESIPLCNENLGNAAFVADYIGEQLSEGPDYAIISKLDSKYIIGATPTEDAACALGIEEKSFIKNDVYQGNVSSAKLKEFLDNPKLYRLELDKLVPAQTNSSSTFFHRQSQLSESPSANEYGSYQCER